MRIGLAQINSTVGDLAGNRRKILDAYRTLIARGAELVVFPELIICGYPPRDLLFKRRFVADNEESLTMIATEIGFELKPGEVVVDLGSGAGFDCFLASRRVGENGKVIGVDMTP